MRTTKDAATKKAKTVSDLMSKPALTLKPDQTAADAARRMRDADIGDVLVAENGELYGIVTDRDLVVRCMADGNDPETVRLDELCSTELITLSPDSELGEAVAMMRENAVRRVPVVDGKKPVGIVSIGDLAMALDRQSALGEISAAPPNR